MKAKTILLLAIAAAGLSTARADIVMVNETNVGGVKSTTTMSIHGDKVRTDNGAQTSVIMDTKTGDMTTLMHEQKMMMKSNAEQLKAAAAALGDKGAPGGAEAMQPKITATGKKEKVQGYECEIYTMEIMGLSTKMWIAKDYPGYEKLKKELSVLEKLGSPGAAKQPPLPGLALKTEMEQQGMKITTALVSLKEQPVDESIFSVPAGYKALGQ